MSLVLLDGPQEEPVTLEEIKAHLGLQNTFQDGVLQDMLDAIAQDLDGPDGKLGRSVMRQKWLWTLPEFPHNDLALRVPLPKLFKVDSIVYTDPDGVQQTLPDTEYVTQRGAKPKGLIVPAPTASWPATRYDPEAVKITYQAGWIRKPDPLPAEEKDMVLPAPIQQAIKLQVTDMYRHRGDVVTGTIVNYIKAADRLLRGYRVYDISVPEVSPHEDRRPPGYRP